MAQTNISRSEQGVQGYAEDGGGNNDLSTILNMARLNDAPNNVGHEPRIAQAQPNPQFLPQPPIQGLFLAS